MSKLTGWALDLTRLGSAARGAIWRPSFWAGGWMGLAHIVRCRPGGTHGYDPVPDAVPEQGRWYLPWTYGRWK